MPGFYYTEIASPLMLGTAQYRSPAILAQAFRASGAGIATVSLRRGAGGGQDFLRFNKGLGVPILPNTACCHTDLLSPDVFALVAAARELTAQGFRVFPYSTEDLSVRGRLLDAGCGRCGRCGPSSRTCRWLSMPAPACPASPRRR